MKLTARFLFLLIVALLLANNGMAQQISIDRGLRAGGLWCFPLVTDEKVYVYIPAGARLATDDNGHPQFSFVRYVVNRPAEGQGSETITAAAGGGVLHFLVLLETPQAMIDAAQKGLREAIGDDEVQLRGPLVFQDGRYALVSSILDPADGKKERSMLAAGRAPVLEGNRLAFSFDLDPERASLLLESFKMATPDISLVFDMTFEGLTDAYDAELTVDWSEVRRSESFDAGASLYFISADVEAMFDEMRRDNTIVLRTSGSNAAMESLLTTVYTRLLDLLFRRVEPEKVPPDKRGGLTEALGELIDQKSGPLSSRKTTGFGAYVGYQLKDIRSSGVSVLNFNHRANVERHSLISFNIGDIHRRYGDNPDYFKAVNLDDPTFQQREIHIGLDGALQTEFERFINSVTLTLRKRHAGGAQTIRELVIDPTALEKEPGALRLVYGWNGDDDRLAWLEYDYRTRWSFKGGGSYQTEWISTDAPMVQLFVPYERRTVQLAGSGALLRDKGVRAVVVQVEYPFFEGTRREQIVARPAQPLEEQLVEITLPLDQYEYQYTITWQLDGSRRLTRSGRDSTGLLFVDELPADTEAAPAQ